MIHICMLMLSHTEAHLKCVEGVRAYIAKNQLPWHLQLLEPDQVKGAPADAWWILFRNAQHAAIPKDAADKAILLLGKKSNAYCKYDDMAFAELAVRHLQEQGYPTIGVVDDPSHPRHRSMHKALVAACKKQDLPLLHHLHDDPSRIDALIDWLREAPHPLAIYAFSDHHAVFLRNIIVNAGLRIPEDIALLGTGDQVKICMANEPTISSITYPFRLIGEGAARYLHHRLMHHDAPPPYMMRPYKVSIRNSTAKRGISDPLVRRATKWLRKNLQSSRPLQEAADHCQCSIQCLCKHFQAELNTSPKQVHDRLRCEKACELLTERHRKMADIAKQCGYRSNTVFGIAFKRRYGCSPSQWRKATL